uniref:C2H2-type domain-containing protein n=1 Tax=viral metagenome TaxID=1070528 RepID=A0A6M3JLF3_9ZZZZ
MKVKEYMDLYGLKTQEDLRLHFRSNMLQEKLPVAMYSCPKCDEILNDAEDINIHECIEGEKYEL